MRDVCLISPLGLLIGSSIAFSFCPCLFFLKEAVSYTDLRAGSALEQMVAAGLSHTVLLRSDGAAVACGDICDGHCDLPALEAGLTYVAASAGSNHTVLLKSNWAAAACGNNDCGQSDLPALGEGLTFVQASAGEYHTVLL